MAEAGLPAVMAFASILAERIAGAHAVDVAAEMGEGRRALG
jgi:hypothetical protein